MEEHITYEAVLPKKFYTDFNKPLGLIIRTGKTQGKETC
jgi:hypothetical protein